MSGHVVAPAGYGGDLAVAVGPRLLAGVPHGPGLDGHRRIWPEPRPIPADKLVAACSAVDLRGRGGAGFPVARKLGTALAAGKRRAVVVNASEGEPGSAKDAALLLTVPHLVLDGATVVAGSLGSDTVHLVVPKERPAVVEAARRAVAERPRGGPRFEVREGGGSFVAGQGRAVLELLEGRRAAPVTSWRPEAVSGLRHRPTVLSNAETYAQLAALAALGVDTFRCTGTDDEPGTMLLTVAGDGPGGVVLEVPFGTPLPDVLGHCGYDPSSTVLMGGYHGTWIPGEYVPYRRISRRDLGSVGAAPGAGVVLPLDPAACPVAVTAQIVAYLAAHSAGRCGPCRNGLPAMARSLELLAGGNPAGTSRTEELAGLVAGRGACAHPDGTARIARSLFVAFPDEVAVHESGHCSVSAGVMAR